MEIILTAKNTSVNPALREYVEKKLGRLTKYFERVNLVAQVTLSAERDRRIIEVTVPVNGLILRGEEAAQDFYAATDLVVDKLERQIHKYKTRINRRFRQQGADLPDGREGEDEEEPRVVKMKRFTMKPMAVEEAIMQMNLIGHDFFVFTNSESELINVVYRRKDGNYGLIEPEG